MKVALIGCHKQHNYGSLLQTLANQVAVQSLGHDCENLVYVRDYTFTEKLKQIPRVLNGGNQRKLLRVLRAKKMARKYPSIAKSRGARDDVFEEYINTVFTNLSRPYVGFRDLSEGSRDYDAIMVGSDQMWLPMGLPTNFYNLEFAAPGVRRISYATSFGVSEIPWYQKKRTAEYLQRIDYLSVREDAGAKICKEVADVNAEVVVDPTLLLTKEQWLELIPEQRTMSDPYVFCYFLGSNPLCREEALKISESMSLPIVTLKHLDEIIPSDESFGDYAPYGIDPAGFVNLIRNAEYVLTDSFHGTVFSIMNHKQFVTFYRFAELDKQSRNSRIDSLFSHLSLTDRLVKNPGQCAQMLNNEVDYSSVDDSLAVWRKDSWEFLERALS